MTLYRTIISILAMFVLLAACSTAKPTGNLQPTATMRSDYPEPGQGIGGDENAIPFLLDKPILAGAKEISGSGVPGVPIAILDITLMGPVLGQTTIKEDGSFVVEVSPLEAGHRVGLFLANLEGTSWKPEDFQDKGYFGEEARMVPMVGFFYDTALVKATSTQ